MNIKDTIITSELSNGKILLRQLQDTDKQAVFDIYSDEESAKLDDWVPFKTIEEASTLIDQSKKNFSDKTELRYGIEDLSRKCLIGTCGIFGFDDWNKKCMIYYQVHHSERNKGFASSAVKLLVNFIFEKLSANRIEAYVTPGNTSSIRVLEKNGFQNEGILREMEYYKDKFWDGIVMGMIRKDFEELDPRKNTSDN